MRGEHRAAHRERLPCAGSSPHARGALYDWAEEQGSYGIIPACAGSTNASGGLWCEERDHPRMRGEHLMPFIWPALRVGSSPHARGARWISRSWTCSVGIIPACAGSTDVHSIPALSCRDHPRMRGEHSHESRRLSSIVGSSPHARGAPPNHRLCHTR